MHFAYPMRPDVAVFRGYNLTIEAGQTVALVGESGGGKSTVISLLERFYDPLEGQVLLDDTDIRTLNVQWLRDQIGLVSQEPVLFAASIMENIRHGKRGATDEEVVEAAKMANAHGFITAFPDGYGTEVGERGVQLSGGQKQRIAIARAVIKDPTVLLLDEATSALDSESEGVVQAALDELMRGKRRTTVVVAHRLSTITNADSIAVVYNGSIVEQGTHGELMKIPNGFFANLATMQQLAKEDDSSSPTTMTTTMTTMTTTKGESSSSGASSRSPSEGRSTALEPLDIEQGEAAAAATTTTATRTTATRTLAEKGQADFIGGNSGGGDGKIPGGVSVDDVLFVNLSTMDKAKLRQLDTGALLAQAEGRGEDGGGGGGGGVSLARRVWRMHTGDTHLLLLGLAGQFFGGAFEPLLGMLMGLMVASFYVDIDDDDDDDGSGSGSGGGGDPDYDRMRRRANGLAVGFAALGFLRFLCELSRWAFGLGVSNCSHRLRVAFFASMLRQEVAFHDAT